MISSTEQTFLWVLILAMAAFSAGIFFVLLRSRRRQGEDVGPSLPQNSGESIAKEISPPSSGISPTQARQISAPSVSTEPVTAAAPSLGQALGKTREGFWGRIQKLLSLPLTSAAGKGSADLQEQLEEVLYTSDLGSRTVEYLLHDLKWDSSLEPASLLQSLQSQLKEKMLAELQVLEALPAPVVGKPRIIMVVGVNGAGKTTSIGKLAHLYHQQNLKVLVAAGDTFRAAAGEQLKTWSERAQVEIFWPSGTQDPSGIAFQATQKAVQESFDVALIDTAGRLHTQAHLMEELKKVKRSIAKALPGAPHEILLVLDANSGQNALIQAENFHSALQITGVLVTKLDGSAKGGVVLGLAHQLQLPVRWVGLGEGIEDLQSFSAMEYVHSLFEAR